MVLDVRAEIICNLGPVISGSVRDDHIQGQGLIFTTGEVVIAGLITPAKGDRVTLAYVTPDGGTVARFPRGDFKVTQAFANPLSNQTVVQLANDLAYEQGKGGGVVSSNLLDGLNRGVLHTNPVMNLHEAAELICSRIGITVKSLGTWEINQQITSLESEDYIETLSDMLASAGHVGYLNAENALEAIPYADLPTNGPVVTFDQVVDINPNSGGVDFTENPTGTGTAQEVEEVQALYTAGVHISEGTLGTFSSSWDNNGVSTQTTIKVTLKNGSTQSFPITETVITSESKAEPDSRTTERITETTTARVKVNSQLVQDFLEKGLTDHGATQLVTSRKVDQYEYQQIDPPEATEEEQAQTEEEVQTAIDNIIANSELYDSMPPSAEDLRIVLLPNLPTFRQTLHVATETISYVEALGRIGIKDYTLLSSIPSGEGTSSVIHTQYLYSASVVREIKTTYVAYGLTQMGQQAISKAANLVRVDSVTGKVDPQPFLDQFFPLVVENLEVITTDQPQDSEESTVPNYLAPYQSADVVLQGSSQIQVGEEPEQRANNSSVFQVPFLSDDIVNDDGTISDADAVSEAAQFAEDQNRLLIGHRLGLQVTTGLNVLPSNPMQAFHLTSNDITAMYRMNGTAWAFDANSCMVSTDALYWGLAGGDVNGPLWTPVAPGTTALPTPPAPVVNGAQPPVNSITVEGPVDVSNQAAINALLAALPNDEVEVFETELEPVALALPFKPIIKTSLQVRLQLEAITVPLGINRLMDDPELQVRLQLEAVQALSSQVVLELESGERELLAETFSAGLGLGGNLS